MEDALRVLTKLVRDAASGATGDGRDGSGCPWCYSYEPEIKLHEPDCPGIEGLRTSKRALR